MMSDEEENAENAAADDAADAGAGDAPDEGGGEGEGGGDSKKKLLLLVIPLFVLLGVGGGLYFSGMLDSYLGGEKCTEKLDEHGEAVLDDHGEPVMECPEEEEEHHEAAADDHGGGHGDDGHGGGASGAFVAIPTMIVNLNNPDGTSSYLRLTVQIELENPSDAPQIEAVMPRVVDQFQTYLRELRPQDLRGSAGLYRLQMELLWRVNQAASPVKVKDVLFQEILIQ